MGEVETVTAAQTLLSDKIAFAALIVAFLSLIISVIGVFVQKRMNKTNLEAKYFELIFNDYILTLIPEKVAQLKFDTNHKLNKNYKELNDVMMEMIRKARYFSFSNPKFYSELSKKTVALDEKLVSISSKKVLQNKDQTKYLGEIEESVSKIIVYINDNYCK